MKNERVIDMLINSKKMLNRYQAALSGAQISIFDWDVRKQVINISQEWWKLIGASSGSETISYSEWFDKIHHEDQEKIKKCLHKYELKNPAKCSFEFRYPGSGSEVIWVRFSGLSIPGSDRHSERVVGVVTNITDQKKRLEETGFLAYNDSLTRLPNRAFLINRLKQLLNRMKRDLDYGITILYLDLDGFKLVNDEYGHRAGDLLLMALAERFLSSVREIDTVSRIGGDEFIILLDGITDRDIIVDIANRLLSETRKDFHFDSNIINISVSIGIDNNIVKESIPNQIIHNADRAMYAAKFAGKGSFKFIESGKKAKENDQWLLEDDLVKIIENDELELFYQPIFNLTTGSVHSFEVLIRWNHPVKGLILPDQFISVAEENGFISSITEWVFREACSKVLSMSHYNAQMNQNIIFDINISAKDFLIDGGVNNLFLNILDEKGCSPQNFSIEVTERDIVSQYELALEQLADLKSKGVSIKLDDFGTGYSSLSYLSNFPIDTLKIDRSFIQQIDNSSSGRQLIKAIIDLGHTMNLEVVAEGVELKEHLEQLYAWKCDYVQGYIYSEPIQGSNLMDYINELPKQVMNS